MMNVTYSVQQKTIDKKLITVTVPRVPLIRGGEGEGIGIFYLGPENIVVLKGLCYAICYLFKKLIYRFSQG